MAIVSRGGRGSGRLPSLIVLMAGIAAGAVADSVTLRGQTIDTFTWSHNGDRLEVSCRGDVEFSDDDLDVRGLTPGGMLRIMERRRAGARSIEFTTTAAGNIERRFSVGTSEQPYETEGRQWLSQFLPHLIRQTGIGAAGRVARILRTKGSAAGLAEISLIEGSRTKRLYFGELLKTPDLDAGALQQALAQAARELVFEPELARLLAANDALLRDKGTRQAYLDAARTIESDLEMRRLFSTALERGPVNSEVLAGVLEISTAIGSDLERASLLVQVAKLQPLDNATRAPFFKALDTLVASDAEYRRVLGAVLEQLERSPETAAAFLASAGTPRGDDQAARLLELVARQQSIEGSLRAPFFRRVASISSAFERSRVLQIAARRKDASEETIMAILGAVHAMTATSDAAQVLLAVAEIHTLSGPARDAYIDEANRILSALAAHARRDVR
jgi:hypothetical protein